MIDCEKEELARRVLGANVDRPVRADCWCVPLGHSVLIWKGGEAPENASSRAYRRQIEAVVYIDCSVRPDGWAVQTSSYGNLIVGIRIFDTPLERSTRAYSRQPGRAADVNGAIGADRRSRLQEVGLREHHKPLLAAVHWIQGTHPALPVCDVISLCWNKMLSARHVNCAVSC